MKKNVNFVCIFVNSTPKDILKWCQSPFYCVIVTHLPFQHIWIHYQ